MTQRKYQTRMTPEERFFWKHAGFGFDPKTETKAQGNRRYAVALAEAEAYAQRKISLGEWSFEWSDDWDIGSHVKEFGEESYPNEPSTCESCVLWQGNRVIASLGCIDDADANYRRVIEAELASEAMHNELREMQERESCSRMDQATA